MKPDTPVILFIVLVLALTTAIATGLVHLPLWVVDSSITTVLLVIFSLGGFAKDPMLGVSFFLLTAVILFSRNVHKTETKLQHFAPNTEEDDTEHFDDIPSEHFNDTPLEATRASITDLVASTNASNAVLAPSAGEAHSPSATLDAFLNEHRAASDGSAVNRTLGVYGEETIPKESHKPAQEFATFVSSPRGMNQFNETSGVVEGFTSEQAPFSEIGLPTDGQYPIEEMRTMSTPDSRQYTYRPDADTGSNSFERMGPDLDEKKAAFQYK
jgi:hypothetical protein